MADDYEILKANRDEIFNALRRLGYTPRENTSQGMTEPELRQSSAQWRLRQKDEKPRSYEEVEWALMEALVIQGSCTVWRGDGLGCAAQIVWAQHERAEDEEALVMVLVEKLKAAQIEIENLKAGIAQMEIDAYTKRGEVDGSMGN